MKLILPAIITAALVFLFKAPLPPEAKPATLFPEDLPQLREQSATLRAEELSTPGDALSDAERWKRIQRAVGAQDDGIIGSESIRKLEIALDIAGIESLPKS